VNDEIVVDAVAVADALTRKDAVGIAYSHRIVSSTCHAPHLIDAEVGQVLRRVERCGQISAESAATGLRSLTTMIDLRYEHHGWLATQAWELRHNVSFYDALYVALAAKLDIPLLTGDVRLSKAPGLPCQVELIV
jgi:predicted nucleic acid-binding protein